MNSIDTIAERLVYAADPALQPSWSIDKKIDYAQRTLDIVCRELDGLGIVIKGNTLFRVLGLAAIRQLADAGLHVFVDYKLFDVQSTCENDGSAIAGIANVKILTVHVDVHPNVFVKLAELLPGVLVAPVGVLTDLTDGIFQKRGLVSRADAVRAFFHNVSDLPCKGIICGPADLKYAPEGFFTGREIITPAIRPVWSFEEGDTNAVNALTPTKAIEAGASRLVVGSPIRKDGDLCRNALRILGEIDEALQ